MPPKLTPQVISAAILGFEEQKRHIDDQIAELRAGLDGGPTKPTPTATETPTIKRRKFSAAARRRMKEAQQQRWAKIRGESEPPAPAAAESRSPNATERLAVPISPHEEGGGGEESGEAKPAHKETAARKR
jgi:hypothetical protein